MARIKQIIICPNQLSKHARAANIVYGFTFSCFKTLSLLLGLFWMKLYGHFTYSFLDCKHRLS